MRGLLFSQHNLLGLFNPLRFPVSMERNPKLRSADELGRLSD